VKGVRWFNSSTPEAVKKMECNMNELINIEERDGIATVNARDLHAVLERNKTICTGSMIEYRNTDSARNTDYVRKICYAAPVGVKTRHRVSSFSRTWRKNLRVSRTPEGPRKSVSISLRLKSVMAVCVVGPRKVKFVRREFTDTLRDQDATTISLQSTLPWR
jgi:hypothetical protein